MLTKFDNSGKLHAVQQALGTKLHLTDNEVAAFVGALLDEVESLKVSNETLISEQGQAILNDEDVAQAYVENFALKVFAKADKDVYNKTSGKGTVQTFIAAATFLDLLKIFQNPLEKDVADKIRYSKYQATRIIKAIKNGEDPNLYDPPAVEKEEERVDELLDQKQTEVSEEAEEDQSEPQFSLPSAASHDPSAEPRSSVSSNPVGNGGLPSVPSFSPDRAPPSVSAEHVTPSYSPSPPPPPVVPVVQQPAVPTPQAVHGHHMTQQEVQTLMNETEVIASAQKHAKFAISALNYEDMTTAVRELTAALDLLKAQGG